MKRTFIALGFDCDRPRGSFINTARGNKMAKLKFKSIKKLSADLDKLGIDRTFFICGEFLESMAKQFGKNTIRRIFNPDSELVEIADHSYSHSLLKNIPVRPDKKTISSKEAMIEYDRNSLIFKEIFGLKNSQRGYRTPLGHYKGLEGKNKLLNSFQNKGISYISSDCRDKRHSLNPPLKNSDNTPRQPYFYSNGLLEIPSHGWQDTVFGGHTKTPIYENHPNNYKEILEYYKFLFTEARTLIPKNDCNLFIALTLHPYNISLYSKNKNFVLDIHAIANRLQIDFCKYKDICYYYGKLKKGKFI